MGTEIPCRKLRRILQMTGGYGFIENVFNATYSVKMVTVINFMLVYILSRLTKAYP